MGLTLSGLQSITTWQQGKFINDPKYQRWNARQKLKAQREERHFVRPLPHGNKICRCIVTADAVWLAERLNLAASLEFKISARINRPFLSWNLVFKAQEKRDADAHDKRGPFAYRKHLINKHSHWTPTGEQVAFCLGGQILCDCDTSKEAHWLAVRLNLAAWLEESLRSIQTGDLSPEEVLAAQYRRNEIYKLLEQ